MMNQPKFQKGDFVTTEINVASDNVKYEVIKIENKPFKKTLRSSEVFQNNYFYDIRSTQDGMVIKNVEEQLLKICDS